jgi:sulfite exporter TauE/SafE
MILFGLGTIPLMSSVVYLKNAVTISIKNKIQKAIPYVAVFIGILFILRGLGLGIPYISPSNTSLYIQQQPNCHR